jgi:hypothetical protein
MRALLFIVLGARVIDGIVKPQRELDLRKTPREMRSRLKYEEALSEMLQRVIEAVRL